MHQLGITPLSTDGNDGASLAYVRRLSGRHRDPLDEFELSTKRPASPRKLAQMRLPSLLSPPECEVADAPTAAFSVNSPLCADAVKDDFDDDVVAAASVACPVAAFSALQHGIMEVIALVERSSKQHRQTDDGGVAKSSSSQDGQKGQTVRSSVRSREEAEKRRRSVNQTPTPSPSKEEAEQASHCNGKLSDECGDGASSSASECSGGPTSPNLDAQILSTLAELAVLADDTRKQVASALAAERSTSMALERKLHSLQKAHDKVAQKLIGSTTRLATVTTLLQQERVASKALLVHVARTGSAPCSSPPAPTPDDPFDIDDDELEPSAVHESPPRAPRQEPESAGPPVECACSILSTLRPHIMANEVLLSRRRLSQYIALIAENPAALAAHHAMLEGKAQALISSHRNGMAAYTSQKQQLLDELSAHA